jgi:hypothetical protein
MNSMNKFNELQIKLTELNSRVRIKFHIKYNHEYLEIGVLYTKFLPTLLRKNRVAQIENTDSDNTFTVSLSKKWTYEQACARVNGQNELALLLHLWLDKRLSFEEMAFQFDNFEYVKPFYAKNLDRNRESEWIEIKTQLFSYYIISWNSKKSYKAYEELLTAAKQREDFKTYHPTLSHNWLRFKSVKGEYLSGYLMATSRNETRGQFYVDAFAFSGKCDAKETLYTDNVEEAIDFYILKCVNAI